MKKDEAISILATSARPREPKNRTRYDEAVKMAIEALKAQDVPETNVEDTISRQTAIDTINSLPKWIDTEHGVCLDYTDVLAVLSEHLPSVESEIIYCKDCKYYGRADKKLFYRGADCLNNHIRTIVADRDYCSKAERRTDGSAD